MRYITSALSDVGIKKNVNQDSVLVQSADTEYGPAVLACVCDGMGGLSEGEYASSLIVKTAAHWFLNYLPDIIYENKGRIDRKHLYRSIDSMINGVDRKISEYAEHKAIACGSTAAGILVIRDTFYCFNVGDSRVYIFHDGLHQITKDQTYVQHEMDAGRMTPEEAEKHPDRNILLQCVGAGTSVVPVFSTGRIESGDLFMICSDGFRHKVGNDEFTGIINPSELHSRKDLEDISYYCIGLNKERREKDNISVVFVKAEE